MVAGIGKHRLDQRQFGAVVKLAGFFQRLEPDRFQRGEQLRVRLMQILERIGNGIVPAALEDERIDLVLVELLDQPLVHPEHFMGRLALQMMEEQVPFPKGNVGQNILGRPIPRADLNHLIVGEFFDGFQKDRPIPVDPGDQLLFARGQAFFFHFTRIAHEFSPQVSVC